MTAKKHAPTGKAKPTNAKTTNAKTTGAKTANAKRAPEAAKTKKTAPQSRLAVLVDGKLLPDDEARTLWQDFSRHMDEHEGDLAGFAKHKGWSSVKPEHRQGRAVLVVTSR